MKVAAWLLPIAWLFSLVNADQLGWLGALGVGLACAFAPAVMLTRALKSDAATSETRIGFFAAVKTALAVATRPMNSLKFENPDARTIQAARVGMVLRMLFAFLPLTLLPLLAAVGKAPVWVDFALIIVGFIALQRILGIKRTPVQK